MNLNAACAKMGDEKSKCLLPSFLVILSFGVYLATISPTVYLGDSGELSAAAFSLGIPHNSGYPLYSLAGKIFCLIPIGNLGFRMNLVSGAFAVGCLWLVYRFVAGMGTSGVAAFSSSLILAFTPLFWLQTTSAEVYSMHLFFVALLINILWKWDRERHFHLLCLFAFVSGLSFGNHLQTLMLAPAAICFVLWRDRRMLLSPGNFVVLTVLFLVALSLYLYLPVRTNAGAAIHWGDPNNLDRFLAHVTGRTHREVYVLHQSFLEYFRRTNQTLLLVGSQLGVLIGIGIFGFIKLRPLRWQVFFILLITFDFIYTVFLNVISLKVTPFALPTLLALAVLTGLGLAKGLAWVGSLSKVSPGTVRLVRGCCYVMPAIPLFLNFVSCNQGPNYTAYEHTVNILRTADQGSILFLEGDNNFFPVAYGRIAERMRPDLLLFDRSNILYKMPYVGERKGPFFGEWKQYRDMLEAEIVQRMFPAGIYYSTFLPTALSVPEGFQLVPLGTLHSVQMKKDPLDPYRIRNIWKYYSAESFYESFEKDFMTRQVQAHFHLRYGQYLFIARQIRLGLRYLKNASQIGHDDDMVHMKIFTLLADYGFYEEARVELEKALAHKDPGVANDSWGVYYYKMGEYRKAAEYFRKALELEPKKPSYLKNLGLALYRMGRVEEALDAFKESIDLNEDQPELKAFMEKEGLIIGKARQEG
ncbi:MAG: DUF2723 domain-containing protein [Deltaproteobacteria bacterium]|nr:DUF2723 domain-containing protein [Deltaproteobacteria bacterium]